jgi:intein-encoded DNA endonuclease-like protein
MRPSHKAEVIAWYEQGMDEADIARRVGHAPESVGQYIRDYERVKMLLTHGIAVSQISVMTGMQPNVVRDYAKLIAQYRPELLPVTQAQRPSTDIQDGDK